MSVATLQLVPKGWTCWNYEVKDGERTLGEVKPSMLALKADVSLDGVAYRFQRKGVWRPEFTAYRGDEVVASAESVGGFGFVLNLKAGGARYRLEGEGFWGLKRRLIDDAGKVHLRAGFDGWTGMRTRLDVDANLPILVAVFVGWIVRSQHVAASGGAAS